MNDDDFGYDKATDRLPAFLASESFTDCAGVRREFELTVRELDGHGFAGRAHEVTADRVRGRIAMDGMVIDGKLLDWAGLQALLSMHEGWDFELRIPFEPEW